MVALFPLNRTYVHIQDVLCADLVSEVLRPAGH